MVAQLSSTQFFGSSTGRWIGQIADDSSWRDNMLAGKFQSPQTIPGWGRRYKVRIMGVHDQQQETIPDDQLPWANIEYPVTAGSGIGGAFQTSQIRQGMFVMGEWMDEDEQVPMITGLLGNNAQTAFEMATGMTGGEAFKPFSGFAEVKIPYTGTSGTKAPDNSLVTGEQSKETANPPPGIPFDKFGIGGNPTPAQLAMIQSATAAGESAGLTGAELDAFTKGRVLEGVNNLKATDGLASKSPIKNATQENADAVHQMSAGDLKRQQKLEEKIVVMKPGDPVKSAMIAVQTTLENLSKEIEHVQDAISSYSGAVAAVGNPVQSMQQLIQDTACQMAKYMKIVFDKIMEYVLKIMNKAMTKVVSALPSSMRYQFSDMKDMIGELTLCLYGKMTNNLCGMISGLLNDLFKPDDLAKKAEEKANTPQDGSNSHPSVPVCTAEEVVGELLAMNQDAIDDANNTLVDNVNAFLDDVQKELSGITGAMSGIMSKMGGITGSMTAALGFANIKLNVFGCELSPVASMSDFYTLARGGSETSKDTEPSPKGVEDSTAKAKETDRKMGGQGGRKTRYNSNKPFTTVPKGENSTSNITSPSTSSTSTTTMSDLKVGDNVSQITDVQERNQIEADLEIERARSGDRSGLDDALDMGY